MASPITTAPSASSSATAAHQHRQYRVCRQLSAQGGLADDASGHKVPVSDDQPGASTADPEAERTIPIYALV